MLNNIVDWIAFALLLILAFLPPVLYAIWIRNIEKYDREKWKSIFLCFLWGATVAIILAIVLELTLDLSFAVSVDDESIFNLATVIIIAPSVEEFTKPLALRLKTVKKELDEFEDGIVYGAVAGLGFSATENLLYGFSFLSRGLMVFFVLMLIRSIGGCLLHASATSITGYGYGKSIIKGTSLLRVLPYFLIAILVHMCYNFFLSYDLIGIIAGLFIALIFVLITIHFIRRKIKTLDRLSSYI
jgi:RsiW-degrading membrane proteinase PrsW (M82 family)